MTERKYCNLLKQKVCIEEQGAKCSFNGRYICNHPSSETGDCHPYDSFAREQKIPLPCQICKREDKYLKCKSLETCSHIDGTHGYSFNKGSPSRKGISKVQSGKSGEIDFWEGFEFPDRDLK